MKRLSTPMFLRIETSEQLDAVSNALDMFFDMEDDLIMDDAITTVREVRALAVLSDDQLTEALRERRIESERRLDQLLAINEVRHNLQISINKSPE